MINKKYNKDLIDIAMKQLLYGGGYKTGIRRWFNPMRYIRGLLYIKYIPIEKMYVKREGEK